MNWIAAKKLIDNKPATFDKVIAEYERNRPTSVNRSKGGKLERIQVDLGETLGFETELIVYQSKLDGVKAAFYVMFNEETDKVHQRQLFEF